MRLTLGLAIRCLTACVRALRIEEPHRLPVAPWGGVLPKRAGRLPKRFPARNGAPGLSQTLCAPEVSPWRRVRARVAQYQPPSSRLRFLLFSLSAPATMSNCRGEEPSFH
jgi:hypothetical protein